LGRGWPLVTLVALLASPAAAPEAAPPQGAPPAASTVAAVDPGAQADPALYRLVHTLQLDLVVRQAQQAVAAAAAAVSADRIILDEQVGALDHDESAAADAATLLSHRMVAAVEAAGAYRRAVTRRRQCGAGLALADRRLSALAVTLYLGTGSPNPVSFGAAQLGVEQQDELETVAAAVEAARRQAATAWRSAVAGAASAGRTLSVDRAAAGYAARGASRASTSLAAAAAAVTRSRDMLTASLDRLAAAQRTRDAAAAVFNGPEGASPAPAPTILGESALNAQQLAGWFQASGYAAQTQATIGQLATWYIEEGRAEGVRGDLAFAQAVLETGGFASPDAVARHNFAGIGHCNTCAAGWTFPSDRLGVRGQIQLLRAFATPGLTAAQLANPPVLPSLDPAKQFREGCCSTWPSLTGVWATDPVYALSILQLYVQMLSWAISHLP
jgi:hypothetical protein